METIEDLMVHNIEALPCELIFKIFNFLEDIDLFSLSKVPFFSTLVNSNEYKWILKKQRCLKLERAFRSTTRPTLPLLIQQRLMLGGTRVLQLWRRGDYLFSCTLLRHIHLTLRFQFLYKQSKLSKLLRFRSPLHVLQERNILPSTSIAQRLMSRWLHLHHFFKKHELIKKIRLNFNASTTPSSSSCSFFTSTTRTFDFLSLRHSLNWFLIHRIPPTELSKRKLVNDKDLFPLICPTIKPRIHFFEHI